MEETITLTMSRDRYTSIISLEARIFENQEQGKGKEPIYVFNTYNYPAYGSSWLKVLNPDEFSEKSASELSAMEGRIQLLNKEVIALNSIIKLKDDEILKFKTSKLKNNWFSSFFVKKTKT